MIDCPPTPRPGERPPPARASEEGLGASGPPACYPQFLKYLHISSLKVLRCKYETRIPSKKERIRMIEIVLHKL